MFYAGMNLSQLARRLHLLQGIKHPQGQQASGLAQLLQPFCHGADGQPR